MEQNKEQKLQLLPCGATKKQVFTMYPSESDSYLRKLMQHIQIENNPHIPEERAKNRQKLSRREFEKLIDVMGVPKGYQNKYRD